MQDVAAQAGVSVSTVSKVLNGRYGVASATSAHVNEVIERLGYQASLVAQSGYELIAYSAGGRVDEHVGWERRYLSRVMGTLVDGAVLVTPTVTDVQYDGPVVAVDPHTGRSTLPTLSADNLQGARAGVEHLLQLGHVRIGMVTGRPGLVSAQLREQGYRQALTEAGLHVDEALLRLGSFETSTARQAARELLWLPDPPTAIFACNDLSALATLEVAAELGLDVPGRLSVLGFDNVPESAMADPPLTTVEQPIRQMGHDAMVMLIALIDGEQPRATQVTLDTTLVLRRSTAPPRTS
jgi:LacI family transcriptional regulator